MNIEVMHDSGTSNFTKDKVCTSYLYKEFVSEFGYDPEVFLYHVDTDLLCIKAQGSWIGSTETQFQGVLDSHDYLSSLKDEAKEVVRARTAELELEPVTYDGEEFSIEAHSLIYYQNLLLKTDTTWPHGIPKFDGTTYSLTEANKLAFANTMMGEHDTIHAAEQDIMNDIDAAGDETELNAVEDTR